MILKFDDLEFDLNRLNFDQAEEVRLAVSDPDVWLGFNSQQKVGILDSLSNFYKNYSEHNPDEFHEAFYVEQNSHYDPSKSNNGGGYHQPLISVYKDGYNLVIDDTSCGDFGDRVKVELFDSLGNKIAEYCKNDVDSNEGSFIETTFTNESQLQMEFINYFRDGYYILTIEEV